MAYLEIIEVLLYGDITVKEIEAQRDEVACPKSHSKQRLSTRYLVYN